MKTRGGAERKGLAGMQLSEDDSGLQIDLAIPIMDRGGRCAGEDPEAGASIFPEEIEASAALVLDRVPSPDAEATPHGPESQLPREASVVKVLEPG